MKTFFSLLVRSGSNKFSLCRYAGVIIVTLAMTGSGFAATTITQWNFNSGTPDSSTTTGSDVPIVGSGTALSVGGVVAFAAANASSDPAAAADDTGFFISSFPSQGTGDRSRGAEFMVSTAGYAGISFTFDQRNSATASQYWELQYTLDGSNWIAYSASGANTSSGLYQFTSGSTWVNGLTADFSSIMAADNNALFGVRLLSAFDPTAGTSYTGTSSGYSGGGTATFDMVTFSGTAVPEPSRVALLIFGLVGFGLRRRR